MGIVYSGQTTSNGILDGSTVDALHGGMRDFLTSCGWSVQRDGSGDGLWRLRSGTTPGGLSGDLWSRKSTGAGTSLILNVSHAAAINYNTALQASADMSLLTGIGFNYRIIANPYYFYLLREASPCPAAQSFMMMIPFVLPDLAGLVSDAIIASCGVTMAITKGLFAAGNASKFGHLNGVGGTAGQWNIYGVASNVKPVWFDDSSEFYEPRVMMSQTGSDGNPVGGTSRAIGYMWDALVPNYAMPRGTTVAYDSSSWYVLTEGTDPGLMVLMP